MQCHDADPNAPTNTQSKVPVGNPASPTKTQPYVPPIIPMGLPHVVQFVTGSLLHMPGPFQLMADRMSRYANAGGEVSIALEFLCLISDLGSKNTAKTYISKLIAMDTLEMVAHGQGGNDRKSNTYRFLGAKRNWRPLPGEEPGTDPWLKLLEVRLESEGLRQQVQDLTARLDLLTNGAAIGHPSVTDGDGATEANSYDTASPEREGGAIGHFEVTDSETSTAAGTDADSYENPDSNRLQGSNGAIGYFEVTDGETSQPAETASHSYESTGSGSPQAESAAIVHSGVNNGPTEGEQYLDRRARVEPLVAEFRDHFARTFTRRGIPGAVHHFSESAENEAELQAQIETLRNEARAAAASPPPVTEDPVPSGRRGVEYCPDCDGPSTTHDGAECCPDCTDRRRRGGG